MGDKFLGIGLTNALGLVFLTFLVSIMLKTLFTIYEIEGISELIRTA